MFVVKECTECKEYKLLDEFHNCKRLVFGKAASCIVCAKSKSIKHYYANREKKLDYQKKKRIYDSDKIKEYKRKYFQKNKNKLLSQQKERYSLNKDLILQKQREYRINRKDILRDYNKKYAILNKDKISNKKKDYYQANKSKIQSYKKEWYKNRYENDALFNLRVRIRSLIGLSFRNKEFKKGTSSREILGCSYEEFKIHIESQFKKGMSWDNRSEWHLDHIIPVSRAKDEQHLIELNHYTNFQPLWAKENLSKGNKIVEKQLKLL